MSRLQDTWSSFSDQVADKYLNGFGNPSEDSKRLLTDVLLQDAKGKPLRLIELGCGNGQLAQFFFGRGMKFIYTGVDFSEPLLAAGRRAFADQPHVQFIKDDVESLASVTDRFDVAIYSHVIEMLSAPEASLRAAKRVADKIAIRFFEPPDHDYSRIDLRTLDNGNPQSPPQPYLRWSMGRDFYRLMLANLGVGKVDVYQSRDRDQVHILHFS